MLEEAVAFYHKLLREPELLAEAKALFDSAFEESRLIFGGRKLSPYLRPHFITEEDFDHITKICETIWGAIQKVKDAAIEDESMLDLLGLTPIERDLIKIDPGYAQVSPTSRLDSFLTASSYSFVELNGESPAGIAYADIGSEIFAKLSVMKRFGERYKVRSLRGSPQLLDTLLRAYKEFSSARPAFVSTPMPRIAIVDLKGLPTEREFELFKEFFEREGFPAIICSPDELEYRNSRLYAADLPIDIVYKRLLINEYIPLLSEHGALLNACRDGAVCMVNSFRSKIIHKKALFAILTDERFAPLFTPQEIRCIAGHVPWTRKVIPGDTTFKNEKIDLEKFILQNRDRLVLKPNDEYGGKGIHIGWNLNSSQWARVLDEATDDGDYIVQERVRTSRELFPVINDDGTLEFREQLVDLDPLLFFGRVGALFTRLSSTELANVSSGGGMVPVFLIDEK